MRVPALRAVDFFAVDLRAVVFLAPPVLRAVERLAVERFAVERLAVERFAGDFVAVERFAVERFAVDFFRVPERELEREPEREEERVDAGTAVVRSSASSVMSPMADSPHVSSASADGALHEPAIDVCDVSPVPLQSSSVMYDLLSWIVRARFPTTLLFNVQRGQHESFRTLLKR